MLGVGIELYDESGNILVSDQTRIASLISIIQLPR